MKHTGDIGLLKRNEIDDIKWDNAISLSSSKLIYATTLFLDGACPGWGALVLGDYEYIMPLPKRKKFGINYLYQPVGLAQCGIFSKDYVSAEVEKYFINTLLSKFSYGRIDLNENFSLDKIAGCSIKTRNNFILSLDKKYDLLFENYNEDGKKNIRRAKRYEQYIEFDSTPEETLLNYLKQYGGKANLKKLKKDFVAFSILLNDLINNNMAFNICSRTVDNELLASAVFGKYKNRLYYLFGAPTNKGRVYKSTHFILDAVIQQYADTGYILDFEGSEIHSVATLYKKFGSTNKPYKSLHFNNLPWIMKIFKK